MLTSLDTNSIKLEPVFPFFNVATPPLHFRVRFLCIINRRRKGSVGLYMGEKQRRIRVNAIESNKLSSLQVQEEMWEHLDDRSGSDYKEDEDEDGEEKKNGLDVENNWDGENSVSVASAIVEKSSANTYEADLLKEVEELLEPEESEILYQNETPNFKKISTGKWNPLHTLALSMQITYMDKLLETLEDIDVVDKDGHTALHKAVIGKKEAVISHLLRKGANPHVRDRDGATPLHYAVQVGAMQTVKLLIKYDVDVSSADNEGWTPLHIAMQTRNRDITKVLLVNGADKTRRNKAGKTPLDLSLCYGKDFKSYDLAKLLKQVPASNSHL